ncbi:MAG TPA: lipid-binding SYLF domain-containing protein [Firmicutes bacterium]|nr:lipid-binding SYLF domain-containing protein [Bacillota bacterium]
MKRFVVIGLLVIFTFSAPVSAAKLPADLLADASSVMKEMSAQPDSEHFHAMLQKAYGVAIFPSVIKAGLGLGGRYGEGLILKYDPHTRGWYGPYFVTMKGLSYGFQVGVQSTALVLVVTSERGMESLQEGKITLGGNLSVAVGPMGRSAEAGTDLQLKAPIYSYSLSKGAFIGASFEGAVIDNNVNANQVFWQEGLTPKQALERRATGESVQALLEELNLSIGNIKVGG